jgi:membrane protease YdiL (CAAX protease family)
MTTNSTALVSDRHPAISLLIIFALVGIGFLLVGPLIGVLVASAFYDTSFLQRMADSETTIGDAMPLLVVQGCATLIGLIITPVVYVNMMENKSIKKFLATERDVKTYLILLVLGVCFMVTISPIVEWNMSVQFPDFMKSFDEWARAKEDQLIGVTKLLTNFTSINQFLFSLLVIALLPAIGEELVFRGLIQNEILRGGSNPHLAIWIAAFLFSAIHMQFFGFFPRMLLGAMFGYLYWWSGNLMIPILAHFIHNGFTLTMIYFYNIGIIDVNVDSEESAPLLLVVVCVVLTAVLLFYLKNYFTDQQSDKSNSEI